MNLSFGEYRLLGEISTNQYLQEPPQHLRSYLAYLIDYNLVVKEGHFWRLTDKGKQVLKLNTPSNSFYRG